MMAMPFSKSISFSLTALFLSACASESCEPDTLISSENQQVELYAIPQIRDDIEQIVFYDEIGGRVVRVYPSQTIVQQLKRYLPTLDEKQLRDPQWLRVSGYAPIVDKCKVYQESDVVLLDSIKSVDVVEEFRGHNTN